MARVDVGQLAAPGVHAGTAQGDEAARVEVAYALADSLDDGPRFEVVDVGRSKRRLDDRRHHRGRRSVADHVGDQEGDRAVAGLDIVVDIAGQLGAGEVAGVDRQARRARSGAEAAGYAGTGGPLRARVRRA